jgi:ABC-2 type transport system permease protein
MRQIWRLALNDLRLTARDRPAAFWLLLFPAVMMWLFGAMGGGGDGSTAISLDVVDGDGGWIAREFVDELRSDQIRMRELSPEESAAAEDRVRTLVIPEGFTEGVLSGHQQVVRLEKEPDSNESYGIAAEVHVTRAIVRTLGRLVELGGDGPMLTREAMRARDRFRELRDRPRLVSLAVTTAGHGQITPSGRAQSVPGILTFSVLMMTLIYGAVFLTMEKDCGMLRRQAILPISRRTLFLGKLAGRLLIAGVQIVLLVLCGRFLFGVSWGDSPVGLVLVLVCYASAVAGLATLLGALLRTAAQASSVGWILAMIMASLGGCWWPSEVMPRWLWTAAHAMPTAWAMDAFHSLISFGRGIEAVWLPSLALLAFAAVFTAAGVRYLRVDG